MKNRMPSILDFINKYSGLYYLYVVGLILILGNMLVSFSCHLENKIVSFTGFGFIALATCIDVSRILYVFYKRTPAQLIALGFISCVFYGVAEIVAKNIISDVTGVDPNTFNDSIYIFKSAIFTYLWLFILAVIFLGSFILFSIYQLYLKDANEPNATFPTIRDSLRKSFKKTFIEYRFKNICHALLCFSCGFVSAYTTLQTSSILINYNYAPQIIHYSSYYKNNAQCKKVDPNKYIKLLGNNSVSVSPFGDSFSDNLSNNGKFQMLECN